MENNCDIYTHLSPSRVEHKFFLSHFFFIFSVRSSRREKKIISGTKKKKNFSNSVRSRSIWIDWDNSLSIRFVFIQLKLQTGTIGCFGKAMKLIRSNVLFYTFAILYMVVSTNAGSRLWYRWHFGDDDNEMTFSVRWERRGGGRGGGRRLTEH